MVKLNRHKIIAEFESIQHVDTHLHKSLSQSNEGYRKMEFDVALLFLVF